MNIFKYSELIRHLSSRDIKARYKQSFLSFFWIILNPLFQISIMSFVFSHLMRVQEIKIPYVIFIYAGLLPWIFFANSVTASTGALVGNAALIKKIYFPREILILSTLLAKTFDFFFASIIFLVLMIMFKVQFTFFMLLFFPIFLIQFLFTYSLALFLSAINLFYRDVQYLFELVMTLWFYMTPIVYATEFFPEQYRWIFKLNPMAVFINAYRQVLLGGDWPNWNSLAIATFFSIVLYFGALKIFKKLEGTFADVV